MPKICVVTGTRAEYGLLYWLMKEIQHEPNMALQVVVTGAHLAPDFGLTYRLIEEDGFVIQEKIDMLLSSDSAVGAVKSLGLATICLADAFARLQPDIIVILGDRYEMLAVAQTAMLMQIPLAHLHGGEITEGAVDDVIRHAITKLSHVHFTATEEYRARVIQLGEAPGRVYNVGALGLDAVKNIVLLSEKELEKDLKFVFREHNLLVTYHPETLLSDRENMKALENLLAAIEAFPQAGVIITGANADVCGNKFNQRLQAFAEQHAQRVVFRMSLGQQRYFSALQCSDLVVGNSSSGIIEAPFFLKPTVNIGNRQNGRIRTRTIIDCTAETTAITEAMGTALSPAFLQRIAGLDGNSPYGDGTSAKKIAAILNNISNYRDLLQKNFYDLPVNV